MATLKSVLITGAGSGIGAATAKLFSDHGYFVFLLGRDKDKLSRIQKNTKSSEIIICDLAQPEQIQKASDLIHNSNTTLEVLVNNAGVFSSQSFIQTKDEEWNRQWEVNVMGPVRLTRALFPLMQKNKKGSIVHVSSTLGLRPTAGTVAYSAVKAALVNFSTGLALEGAPDHIRSNVICPGLIDTPIHSFHHLKAEEKALQVQQLGPVQPLGRIGTAEEVAAAIYFLGSDQSPWTTGAVLSVDGGINIK